MDRKSRDVISGIYEKALGKHWPRLSKPIRDLHNRRLTLSWKGFFRIENGTHWLAKAIVLLMRLPRKTERTPLRLEIERFKNGEKWIRQIGAHRLVTTQFEGKHGRILERMDGLEFAFDLRVKNGGIVYDQKGCGLRLGFLFIPLPKILSPRIAAREHSTQKNISVRVEIRAPIAGLLVSYDGRITA